MCFAPFYNALFKARITGAADTLNFIKEAFLDYAINHWRKRWIDRRTLKGVAQNVNRRFVGASEIAVSLGIDRRTVLRHLGKPPDDPVYRGKIQPLFHAEQFAVNTNSVVEILNERTAAKETGLSVSVLRALRASGDFEVRHQMRTQVGYRNEDVRAFRERLIQVAIAACEGKPRMIKIKELMRSSRYSTNEKASVVRRIMHRIMFVYRGSDETVGNIEIDSSVLDSAIRETRSQDKGLVVDAVRATEMIGCGAEVLNELIHRGLVVGERRRTCWEISEKSVVAFCEGYKTVAAIAPRAGTSPRRIIQVAHGAGIEVLLVRASQTRSQAFVRASDVCTLERLAKRST
jgi:hypothetical protein